MVFYLQQNVVLLDQISRQILSIAPQATITPNPPPPFPFKLLESDIRVNVFWFMALIFSLTAALLATLMQQWVRNYMHVFQQYSDPLKCARVRQYLRGGLERGWMPGIAEAVPGFLHVSLFLFFAGLCDFVLNINTRVGISTTVPIAISGLLYIIATFVPFFFPRSPYQTWFSTIFSAIFSIITSFIWYSKQIWNYLQRRGGGSDESKKPVRQNMSQRRMLLAMKETDQRNVRDEDAIRWLFRNRTEDSEMESLVLAIPGSFDRQWGLKVWKSVSKPLANDPHTHTHVEDIVHELTVRAIRILETCQNRGPSDGDVLWRTRTRACIETTASLVFCIGGDRGHIGDFVVLLYDIGKDQTVRESSSVGKDQMFVMRWTCLSLVAIQPFLASDRNLQNHASLAMSHLSKDLEHTDHLSADRGHTSTDGTSKDQDHTDVLSKVRDHADKTKNPPRIIEILDNAVKCLEELSDALFLVENIEEVGARKALGGHEDAISTLAVIGDQYDDSADTWIQAVQRDLVEITNRIICQLPGIKFDDLGPDTKSVHPSQPSQLKESYRDRHKFQIISPSHLLKRIRQVADTFQDVLNGQWDYFAFSEGIKDLEEILSFLSDDPLHREVWRLHDLCEGRGLGFTVELFFFARKQLLSTPSSKESHSALFVGTLQAITSDLSEYESPLGTQKLLLDWVVSDNDIIFGPTDTYPDPVIDEFFSLLGTVIRGQKGPHMNDVVKRLTEKLRFPYLFPPRRAFYLKALEVITRAGAQRPPS